LHLLLFSLALSTALVFSRFFSLLFPPASLTHFIDKIVAFVLPLDFLPDVSL
jgi:hypothetical protein